MNFALDVLKQTASLLISIGALTAVAFVFREWIKRVVDHYYKVSEARTELGNQMRLEFARHQVPMAIEMTQIVYKARNSASEILTKRTGLVPEREYLMQCIAILTEKLYAYRVLLDDDIFTMLHEFKRAGQDFLTYLDIFDRPESLREGRLYFSQEVGKALSELHQRMDERYQKVSVHFQRKYRIEDG